MTPLRSCKEYLQDILDAVASARRFTTGMTYEQFVHDEKTRYAVVHALEMIGEAATRIPQPLKDAYPQVPWSQMMATRNRLIHGYWAVDSEVVWDTVFEDLPPLEPLIRRVLEQVSAGSD